MSSEGINQLFPVGKINNKLYACFMSRIVKISSLLFRLLMLLVFTIPVVAEEFTVLFSATVQGETEPCG